MPFWGHPHPKGALVFSKTHLIVLLPSVLSLLVASFGRAYAEQWYNDPNRPWSLSVNVGQGYNSNVDTDSDDDGSFETTVTPSASLTLDLERTDVSFNYSYNFVYYWDSTDEDDTDENHSFGGSITHSFTPRFSVSLSDNFVYGVEPTLAKDEVTSASIVTSRRGDYYNNVVSVDAGYEISERWSVSAGGGWSLWRYDESTAVTTNLAGKVNDRDRYSGNASVGYSLSPRTSVSVSYTFSMIEYKESNFFNTNNLSKFKDSRNSQSHSGSLSFSHEFNPKLNGSINGGATYVVYEDGSDNIAPLGGASLSYSYLPKGSVTASVAGGLTTTELSTYRSSGTLAASLGVTHPFTAKISGNAQVQYTYSRFQDPDPALTPEPAEDDEHTVLIGLGAAYEVTRWFSVGLSYGVDAVSSDENSRDFSRHRVSLNARATY